MEDETLVAGSTDSTEFIGLTIVAHWDTPTLSIEHISGRALQADLVVPVPSGASIVSRPSQAGEDAIVVEVQLEAFIALNADIVGVEDFAVVSQSDTLSVVVHHIASGASETDLSIPIPLGASSVGGRVIQGQVLDTGSCLLISGETFVAGSTPPIDIERPAVIVQGLANSIVVKSEPLRAGDTDLLLPVPLSASQIRGTPNVDGVHNTPTVGYDESGVALDTLVIGVESLTVQVEEDASSTVVESVPGGTLEADLLVPVPAGTSQISGAVQVDLRENTGSSAGQVETLVAADAPVLLVEPLAVIIKRGADSIGVEHESLRAGDADQVVPVEHGTALVESDQALVHSDTDSVLELVASVAPVTLVLLVEGLAIVVQGHADSIVVEGESLRAGDADLLVPVPLSTAQIGGAGQVELISHTDTVLDPVSLVTVRTGGVGIEVSTV